MRRYAYHGIGNPPMHRQDVSSVQLTQHIKTLKRLGFMFTTNPTSDELRKTFLSFDDGYKSACVKGLEILLQEGAVAVVFVIPSWIEGESVTSVHGEPASWSDLKEWIAAGMEVGSHSLTHSRELVALSESDLIREISDSKKFIEDKLGVPVNGFSYPYGNCSTTLQKVLCESGYKYALTVNAPGAECQTEDRFTLRRIGVGASTSSVKFLVKTFLN